MRYWIVACLLGLVLALLPVSGNAQSSSEVRPTNCPKQRPVARNARVRVIFCDGLLSSRYVPNGRQEYLEVDGEGSGLFRLTVFAAVDDPCVACKERGQDFVVVTNARTGRSRGLPFAGQRATDLALSDTGAVASIRLADTAAGSVRQVQRHHRGGVTVLDQGEGIEPRSLTVRGSTLSWRASGRTRTSDLRRHSTL